MQTGVRMRIDAFAPICSGYRLVIDMILVIVNLVKDFLFVIVKESFQGCNLYFLAVHSKNLNCSCILALMSTAHKSYLLSKKLLVPVCSAHSSPCALEFH